MEMGSEFQALPGTAEDETYSQSLYKDIRAYSYKTCAFLYSSPLRQNGEVFLFSCHEPLHTANLYHHRKVAGCSTVLIYGWFHMNILPQPRILSHTLKTEVLVTSEILLHAY